MFSTIYFSKVSSNSSMMKRTEMFAKSRKQMEDMRRKICARGSNPEDNSGNRIHRER